MHDFLVECCKELALRFEVGCKRLERCMTFTKCENTIAFQLLLHACVSSHVVTGCRWTGDEAARLPAPEW